MSRTFIGSFLLLIFFAFSAQGTNENAQLSPKEQNQVILLNTFPRSGSIFIYTTLYNNLNYQTGRIASGRFYNVWLREDLIRNLLGTKHVVQEHINASVDNLVMLEQYFPKFVLNLRDPRQTMLSWYYFVEAKNQAYLHLWADVIFIPFQYCHWTFEEKIDWQIENYLPLAVKWIQDWCVAIDSGKMQILVTRFEDMCDDPQAFFQKIADFYDLPVKEFIIPEFCPGKLHQRLGEKREWERVYNDKQKKRISEIIPPELLERFGWN